MSSSNKKPLNSDNTLTAIDLFSGCGGLTYGLKKAKFNVIAALEIDSAAVSAYELNHKNVNLKKADIREIIGKEWMFELNLKPGELDLLAGCPPCQGFSRLRTRNGTLPNDDPRNNLLLNMLALIKVFKPKTVMMENVPDLIHQGVFEKFLGGLRKSGYKPLWEVLDASKYGVPQRRRRLVLLAGRGFEIPFGSEVKKHTTVRKAIGDLPKSGNSGDWLHDIPEKRTEEVRQRIAAIPKDGGSRKDLPEEMQLPCHKRTRGFSDIYGRMKWDDVSPTITSGCLNPSKGRFLHPEENRSITIREAALLQTFPKNFKLPGNTFKDDAATMIGNALPPKFVHHHALAIKKAIEENINLIKK